VVRKDKVNEILPQLEISDRDKMAIKNYVNAAQVVIVPKKEVEFYGWKGVGYIAINPETGAGAYIISRTGAGGGHILGKDTKLRTQVEALIDVAGRLLLSSEHPLVKSTKNYCDEIISVLEQEGRIDEHKEASLVSWANTIMLNLALMNCIGPVVKIIKTILSGSLIVALITAISTLLPGHPASGVVAFGKALLGYIILHTLPIVLTMMLLE
jgi:hypothetical protein